MPAIRQSLLRPFLAVVCLVLAALPTRAADPKFDPAKTRAELERRAKELRERADKATRDARSRLKLPESSGARPNLPTPAATRSPAGAQSTRSRIEPSPLAYRPVRGRDYAFRVEMATGSGDDRMKWTGDVYLKGIFTDSPGEMYCIGRLAAYRWIEPRQEWHRLATEDIVFPEHVRFAASGVLGTETTGLFDNHTLPMQMSAILPVEQLLFPDLPVHADSPTDLRGDATFYIRSEPSGPFALFPDLTELKGETRRVVRVDDERSSRPKVVNSYGFFCAEREMGMKYQQSAAFDVSGGMVAGSTLEFTLQWERDFRMHVDVQPLAGDGLAAAKQAALERVPYSRWPTYLRRTPADHQDYEIGFPRSASELRPDQPLAVSVANDRHASDTRLYAATVDRILDNRRIRARLDGSDELVEVALTSLHRLKP